MAIPESTTKQVCLHAAHTKLTSAASEIMDALANHLLPAGDPIPDIKYALEDLEDAVSYLRDFINNTSTPKHSTIAIVTTEAEGV